MSNKLPSPWSEEFYTGNGVKKISSDEIQHIGNKNSGRYRRGSGKNPKWSMGGDVPTEFKGSYVTWPGDRDTKWAKMRTPKSVKHMYDKSPQIQSVAHTAIRQHEKKHRNDRVESLQVVDKNGKILINKSDKATNSVSVSAAEVKKMKGQLMTHNHPRGSPFSPQDLCMMHITQMSEGRAGGPKGTYYMRAKADGSSKYVDPQKAWRAIQIMDINTRNNKVIPLIQDRRIADPEEAQQLLNHLVSKQFAKKYNFEYGLEDIPNA